MLRHALPSLLHSFLFGMFIGILAPVHAASRNGHTECLRLLLLAGVSVESPSATGTVLPFNCLVICWVIYVEFMFVQVHSFIIGHHRWVFSLDVTSHATYVQQAPSCLATAYWFFFGSIKFCYRLFKSLAVKMAMVLDIFLLEVSSHSFTCIIFYTA